MVIPADRNGEARAGSGPGTPCLLWPRHVQNNSLPPLARLPEGAGPREERGKPATLSSYSLQVKLNIFPSIGIFWALTNSNYS